MSHELTQQEAKQAVEDAGWRELCAWDYEWFCSDNEGYNKWAKEREVEKWIKVT